MNDDCVLPFGLISHYLCFSTDVNAPSTRPVRLNNAGAARNNGPCLKIGPRNIANQLVDTDLGVVEQGQTTSHDFAHVVGWDVSRHTHSNTS